MSAILDYSSGDAGEGFEVWQTNKKPQDNKTLRF
jgi:hypothetical protein